jgi:hypothetical protein
MILARGNKQEHHRAYHPIRESSNYFYFSASKFVDSALLLFCLFSGKCMRGVLANSPHASRHDQAHTQIQRQPSPRCTSTCCIGCWQLQSFFIAYIMLTKDGFVFLAPPRSPAG